MNAKAEAVYENRFHLRPAVNCGKFKWSVNDCADRSDGLPCFTSRIQALAFIARRIVEEEQSVLAEAFQECRREDGIDLTYFDALDELIYLATKNPSRLLDFLPKLREVAHKRGETVLSISAV